MIVAHLSIHEQRGGYIVSGSLGNITGILSKETHNTIGEALREMHKLIGREEIRYESGSSIYLNWKPNNNSL